MKSILAIGMIAMSLSFCNLLNKNKNDNNSNNSNNKNSSSSTTGGGVTVEQPHPTAAQTAAVENGLSVSWNDQGMNWTLPSDWKEEDTKKETLTYSSPGHAFLIVSISALGSDFPVDVSLDAYYKGQSDQMKNGKVDELKMLQLDGVKGVQFRESPPEDKNGIRRLQWIAYRKYGGQVQQVNVMLSTDADKFEKNQDAFYGILYSTRLVH